MSDGTVTQNALPERYMGLFLPLEASAAGHSKITKLGRRLGLSHTYALGHLAMLWCRLCAESPDGFLLDYESIEILAAWDGEPGKFAQEAISVGLIDETEDGFVVHEFYDRMHHLKIAKKRRQTRDRVRKHRQRQREEQARLCTPEGCNAKSVTKSVTSVTSVTVTGEQNRTEPNTHTGPSVCDDDLTVWLREHGVISSNRRSGWPRLALLKPTQEELDAALTCWSPGKAPDYLAAVIEARRRDAAASVTVTQRPPPPTATAARVERERRWGELLRETAMPAERDRLARLVERGEPDEHDRESLLAARGQWSRYDDAERAAAAAALARIRA